jgi:hypothetical protein
VSRTEKDARKKVVGMMAKRNMEERDKGDFWVVI